MKYVDAKALQVTADQAKEAVEGEDRIWWLSSDCKVEACIDEFYVTNKFGAPYLLSDALENNLMTDLTAYHEKYKAWVAGDVDELPDNVPQP